MLLFYYLVCYFLSLFACCMQDCSSFKAGTDKLRSQADKKGLEVSGVFGSACKHEIPRTFLNMKHGER